MSIVPVRGLGSSGIIADISPTDLGSASVFSGGVNVRFKNGKVTRAPVPRLVATLPHQPGFILSIPPGSSGEDEVVTIAHDLGSIYRLNGATFEDLSVPGYTGIADLAQPITSCFLGGISYVNRETHAPAFKAPGGSTYLTLTNWQTDCRVRVLRAYKDQLIALGVTRGGTYYPTMVKWSDFATFNAVPASWDETLTTNSAGQNIVNEMEHEIIDGATLRDSFIIYCSSSVWEMNYTGDNSIFSFRKLFNDVGAISPNCVAEVKGLHYVFDRTDIYVHDGVSPRSIADGKVKDFIFRGIDLANVNRCFVTHDPRLTEVRFAYPSTDEYAAFPSTTTGCNRMAVFNYGDGTWTFYDIPNAVGGARSALLSGPNWDTDTVVEFEAAGGRWNTAEGDLDRHVMIATRPLTGIAETSRIYGLDLVTGGRLPIPADPSVTPRALVERYAIDMDERGKYLSQYVNFRAIYPQCEVDTPADAAWQFGGHDRPNRRPTWSEEFPYDPDVDDKIDIDEAGKYLGYRFTCGGVSDFTLTGFDAQLVIRGRR
jgi:hypothetical protein